MLDWEMYITAIVHKRVCGAWSSTRVTETQTLTVLFLADVPAFSRKDMFKSR
jgi:hypothetical protein